MSSTGNPEERLNTLYRQRIPTSNYVIYEFSYGGGFVTSNSYAGWTILDSTVPFSSKSIKKLPCTYFAARLVADRLAMLDINPGEAPLTEKDTLLSPVKQYTKRVNGFQIDVAEYHGTYGSASTSTGQMEYQFESLKETADSLTFYNVTHRYGGKIFPAVASFAKGNIKVIDSGEGDIDYIEIKQAVIERNAVYKPGNPLELVPDQPVAGFAWYRFYPKEATKSTVLSDYGIFRRVK